MAPVESATVPVNAGRGECAADAGETEAGDTAKAGPASTKEDDKTKTRSANGFKANSSSANGELERLPQLPAAPESFSVRTGSAGPPLNHWFDPLIGSSDDFLLCSESTSAHSEA